MAAERFPTEPSHAPQELIFSRRLRTLLGALICVFYLCSCAGIALVMNFWFIRVGAAIIVGLGLLIAPGIISDFFTDFDTDGINRPTLFGRRSMRWSEIRRIKKSGAGIVLRSARTQMVLRYSSFRDPQGFVAEIERRVAPSALLTVEELRARGAAAVRAGSVADMPGTTPNSATISTARHPLAEARAALRLPLVLTGGFSILATLHLLWIGPQLGTTFLPGIAIGGALGLLVALVRPWVFAASFSRPGRLPLKPEEVAAREALVRLQRPWPVLAVGVVFALAIAAYATFGESSVPESMVPIAARATTTDAVFYYVGLVAIGILTFLELFIAGAAATYLAVLRASRPLVASEEGGSR